MPITTDSDDPNLKQIRPDGQQESYLVLPGAEQAKGFVRPFRKTYRHVACDGVTTMTDAIAATYATDPAFYNGTFCCRCGQHFSLIGPDKVPAFLWTLDGEPVGS